MNNKTPDDDADIPAAVRRSLAHVVRAKEVTYEYLCALYREGLIAGRASKIGATGEYPFGKLDADDEGELNVAFAADPRQRVVRVEFGKAIGSLALPAGHARQFAAVLLAKATEIERAGH